MPLKKFWKRFFNNDTSTNVRFNVLKSRSSIELSYYDRKQRNSTNSLGLQNSGLRKFNSYYDTVEKAACDSQVCKRDTAEEQKFEVNCNEDNYLNRTLFVHIEDSSDSSLRQNRSDVSVYPLNVDKILDVYEAFANQSNFFRQVVLAKSLESTSLYPNLLWSSLNDTQKEITTNVSRWASEQCSNLKYAQAFYKTLYQIDCTSVDNDACAQCTRGYMIFGYKILNFETVDRLEANWTQWSGAEYVCKCSPRAWKLSRLTFYKLLTSDPQLQRNNFVYILACQFENLIQADHLPVVCQMVERMKLRGCGHVSVYKIQKTTTIDGENEKRENCGLNLCDFVALRHQTSSEFSSQETIATNVSCT